LADIEWTIWSLPLGATLDALAGDPEGWPHPVRAIGWLIEHTERMLRLVLHRLKGGPRLERAAGVMLVIVVAGTTGLSAWGIITVCDRLGAPAALAGRTILVYWGLAARSLAESGLRVVRSPDLESARRALARIVGRDTQQLDKAEISRACVESIAENTNDAVVAPLFWFAVGGPIGLWLYKSINTLDSMVGYRNERYQRLGWASARLDDLAGLVPARLSWILIALASLLVRERAATALRVGWRDGRKHPSPNAAWGEAAMAGALGVQLGGPASYGGRLSIKPFLGEAIVPIGPATIYRAVRLLIVVTFIAVTLAWAVRTGLLGAA
jgi:adenosylcobinamide-phosphate synthase